jgi:prepilin-type N-terminal cleavage/methylation domain-containing protein
MFPFTAPASRPVLPAAPRTVRGFTFTEVMFAVVILGIGFIMVAAIFPVAIRQNAQSAEESLAITAAERGMATLQARASRTMLPATANTVTLAVPPYVEYHAPFIALGEAYNAPSGKVVNNVAAAQQWVNLSGDLISTTDARLGFAVAWARQGTIVYTGVTPPLVIDPASSARMIVVVAQSRERPRFNDTDASASVNRDLRIPKTTTPGVTQWQTQYVDDLQSTATLQFKRLRARFLLGENGAPDQVQFTDAGSNMTTGGPSPLDGVGAVAPGTFLIVADAGNGSPIIVKSSSDPTTNFNARANGRVFRIGNPVAGTRSPTFELIPGQDLTSIPLRTGLSTADQSGMDRPPYFTGSFGTGSIVEVLVLGRTLRDPSIPFNASTNPYVGQPMDIAVYTAPVGLLP